VLKARSTARARTPDDERYHKAAHHKDRFQVRVNLQKKDDAASYAGWITAENPTSGPRAAGGLMAGARATEPGAEARGASTDPFPRKGFSETPLASLEQGAVGPAGSVEFGRPGLLLQFPGVRPSTLDGVGHDRG
jgi:hypothetical protein